MHHVLSLLYNNSTITKKPNVQIDFCLDEGVVDCIETIEKDGTYFTTVFNNGSVDNANFYRFSCLVSLPIPKKEPYVIFLNFLTHFWFVGLRFIQAVSVSGNVVYISDSKGSCQANQTSTSKQNDGSGTLVLTKQGKLFMLLALVVFLARSFFTVVQLNIIFSLFFRKLL